MNLFAKHKFAILCVLAVTVVVGAYLLYDKARTKKGQKSLTPWLHGSEQTNVKAITAVIPEDILSVDQQAAVRKLATSDTIAAERARNEVIAGGPAPAFVGTNHD